MGLNACVYCDCYEKGNVLTPPPDPTLVFRTEDGFLCFREEGMTKDDILKWDRWCASACLHRRGEAIEHHLGNASGIGLIRMELEAEPERYPILLSQVVYNGTHGGDFLLPDLMPALRKELEALDRLVCQDPEIKLLLEIFSRKMGDLARVSTLLDRPIAF